MGYLPRPSGGSVDLSAPGPIGAGTPSTIAFTTATGNSVVLNAPGAGGNVTLVAYDPSAAAEVSIGADATGRSIFLNANLQVTGSAIVSGSNTGDQTNVSGSAGSVAASGITGTTLASSVVSSSLTGVGALTSGSTAAGFTIALSTSTVTGTLAAARFPTAGITGGTIAGLTGFGIRSTGAAFDLTLASSEVFTAGRTLTLTLGDAARTLTLSGNPSLSGVTITGTGTIVTGTKTLTISNTLTLAGTDSTTMTFPSTSATIARIDADNSFSAAQTINTGAADNYLSLKSNNSQYRGLKLFNASNLRFVIHANNNDDFIIDRYTGSSSYQDTPFAINAGTGATSFTKAVTIQTLVVNGTAGVTGATTLTGAVTCAATLRLGNYIVSGLPAAATAGVGATAFVTDGSTTFALGLGLTVAGSGSNKVPVYSDGTNWIVG